MMLLKIMREHRIIAILFSVFALYWGWDAYQFVNIHYADMSGFIIAFYTAIVGVAGWVIKNWMSTSAAEHKEDS